MNTNELFEQWLVDRGYSFFPEEEWVGFQAGYDAAMLEMAEQKPVAWITDDEYGRYISEELHLAYDDNALTVPLIARPTIKGE